MVKALFGLGYTPEWLRDTHGVATPEQLANFGYTPEVLQDIARDLFHSGYEETAIIRLLAQEGKEDFEKLHSIMSSAFG